MTINHCYNDEREVNAPIMMIMTMVMVTMMMVMVMMMLMMMMTWMSEAQTKHWYLAGGSSEHKKKHVDNKEDGTFKEYDDMCLQLLQFWIRSNYSKLSSHPLTASSPASPS